MVTDFQARLGPIKIVDYLLQTLDIFSPLITLLVVLNEQGL